MSVIQPSECSLFIQVWVDTDALVNGQTTGVYIVDNNLNHGSSGEGTVNLSSTVPVGTKICWSLLNIDPNSNSVLQLQNFGNAGVFGASGTPQMVNQTTWTGQVQAPGDDHYNINFSATNSGGSGITTSVNPSLNVH